MSSTVIILSVKMKTKPLFILLSILSISCTSERAPLMTLAEHVIPGSWTIESIRLPGDPMGITYKGSTFFVDTVLFDLGSIDIPEFSADTLTSYIQNPGKVRCTVTIENESFPYSITSLFPSGEDIFAVIRYDGPDGAFLIETPGEKFVWSSFVFNNNYIITIFDKDHIELAKANDQGDHVISLKRL